MFAEDIGAFFDASTGFAVVAMYNGATSVSGIFDNPFFLDSDIVASRNPAFICEKADIPSAAAGDTLVINSVTYVIRSTEADDTDRVWTLQLEKQ